MITQINNHFFWSGKGNNYSLVIFQLQSEWTNMDEFNAKIIKRKLKLFLSKQDIISKFLLLLELTSTNLFSTECQNLFNFYFCLVGRH